MTETAGTEAPKRRFPASSRHYSVHPSIDHIQTIRLNLARTTGRSLSEWIRLARKEGPAVDKERVAWLRREHKLGATTAWIISEAAEGRESEETDPKAYLRKAPEYVEAMYAGAKAGLRPIHDTLIQISRSLGSDVRVCPCKTMVPLYREHVFAEIKPSSRTRIDLGLALKGAPHGKLGPRLTDTGGIAKGNRISHRISIESVEEIDADVRAWLRTAYELDR